MNGNPPDPNTPPPPDRKKTAAGETASARTLRILHLEDNPLDASLVEEMLRLDHVDCDIKVVSEPEDFERELAKGNVDVIISDYSLPRYNGADALRFARKSSKDIPFIFVSGSIGEERAVEVVRLGATDYVMKEHLRRLGIAVRRAMETSDSAQRRREAEAQLEQERDFLSDVFSSVQDSMIVLDTGMNIVRANTTASRLFPQHAPLVGKNCRIFDPPKGKSAMSVLASATIKDGKPGQVISTLGTADGDGEFSIFAYPLIERRSGRQVGAILDLHDVSRERALQAQLIQAQKMECIGQLAGGVAHDFNNILQAIMGFSDMLIADLPDDDPRHDDAVEIRQASDRAASLTRQLLAFSRKQVMQTEDLDLNEVAGHMSKMLQRLMGERIKIQYDLPPAPVRIRGDAGQIEQVILNLVMNGHDAMPKGGDIIVAIRPCEISKDEAAAHGVPWRAGRFIRLSVQDAGIGIPPDVLPRIFEPFFTTKMAGKGTGLGLATVLGIVQQHEGWIDVQSQVGHGTLFSIYLPELPAAGIAAEAVLPGAVKAAALPPGNILVVEDDPLVRQLAVRALQMAGHRVYAFGSAEEGRTYFSAHATEISMLVSDVVLPGTNGLDMAVEFFQARPGLRVLMMSGYLDDKARWDEIQSHGFAFLPKPFSPQTLIDKVNELLAG